MKIISFLKEWTLIIAILTGIIGYFIYVNIPELNFTHHAVHEVVAYAQPILIFVMLSLTFCKVDPRQLKFKKWHLWILLIQAMLFIGLGCVLIAVPDTDQRVIIEGAMLCLICPTATAGAVITRKLGGDVNNITTYTVLINILTAMLIPVLVPFVHPNPDMNVWKSALLILSKVFPLLLFPFFVAMAFKKWLPSVVNWLNRFPDLSFYLWAISLTLAIAVTCHSIVTTEIDLSTELWLVAISLICCVAQFWLGRKIGMRYGDKVTAGQSFGQKNTVLAIWMGYTFFTPVTAVVGGFYSIWHNVINSYQLYKHDHARNLTGTDEAESEEKIGDKNGCHSACEVGK